jgi:hypothetical protein
MKKTVASLSLAAVLLSANAAMAHEKTLVNMDKRSDLGVKVRTWEEGKFVAMGKIKSISGSSFVITVDHFTKQNTSASAKEMTIKTDADTKISMLGDATSVANLKVGYMVVVKGEKDGLNYMADWVQVKGERKHVAGEVTAKSSTSITIKNNVTGVSTTVPVNQETKISINGEDKTITDVQVGDKGFVKIKATLNAMVAKMIKLFR